MKIIKNKFSIRAKVSSCKSNSYPAHHLKILKAAAVNNWQKKIVKKSNDIYITYPLGILVVKIFK